jgi:ATP dependent DNA ligase domain
VPADVAQRAADREVKFDGYRQQLHKDGKDVTLLSKKGNDFTSDVDSDHVPDGSRPAVYGFEAGSYLDQPVAV